MNGNDLHEIYVKLLFLNLVAENAMKMFLSYLVSDYQNCRMSTKEIHTNISDRFSNCSNNFKSLATEERNCIKNGKSVLDQSFVYQVTIKCTTFKKYLNQHKNLEKAVKVLHRLRNITMHSDEVLWDAIQAGTYTDSSVYFKSNCGWSDFFDICYQAIETLWNHLEQKKCGMSREDVRFELNALHEQKYACRDELLRGYDNVTVSLMGMVKNLSSPKAKEISSELREVIKLVMKLQLMTEECFTNGCASNQGHQEYCFAVIGTNICNIVKTKVDSVVPHNLLEVSLDLCELEKTEEKKIEVHVCCTLDSTLSIDKLKYEYSEKVWDCVKEGIVAYCQKDLSIEIELERTCFYWHLEYSVPNLIDVKRLYKQPNPIWYSSFGSPILVAAVVLTFGFVYYKWYSR